VPIEWLIRKKEYYLVYYFKKVVDTAVLTCKEFCTLNFAIAGEEALMETVLYRYSIFLVSLWAKENTTTTSRNNTTTIFFSVKKFFIVIY
jgi:hypothetical protein